MGETNNCRTALVTYNVVVMEIEDPQMLEPPDLRWDRASQLIRVEIQNLQMTQVSQHRGNASR